MKYSRSLSAALLVSLASVACGSDDKGGNATEDGGTSSGGRSGSGGSKSGSGGSENDGGSSGDGGSATDGGSSGDGGSATDGGTGGTSGDGGASGDGGTPTVDDCVPQDGAKPTWTEVDPGLSEYEVRDIGAAGAAPPSGFGGVAYGNGLFVAVGPSSGETKMKWVTSPDGKTWTPHEQPIETGTSYSTSKIHFLNGKFMVFQEHAGNGFAVYTSSDAKKWTESKIQDGRFIVDEFDASPDLTVVAGESGAALRSSDLKKWDPVETVTGGGIFSYNDIAQGDGHWVATINNGGQVYTSPDAETWTMLAGVSTPGGFRVEYGNGIWLLTGPGQLYYTSTDGEKFDKSTPAGPYPNGPIRFTGGRFFTFQGNALGGDDYSVSDDGKTWTEFGSFPAEKVAANEKYRSRLVVDMAYGNCRYVLTGFISVQTNPTDPKDIFSGKQSVLPLVLVGELPSK